MKKSNRQLRTPKKCSQPYVLCKNSFFFFFVPYILGNTFTMKELKNIPQLFESGHLRFAIKSLPRFREFSIVMQHFLLRMSFSLPPLAFALTSGRNKDRISRNYHYQASKEIKKDENGQVKKKNTKTNGREE